MKYILLFIIVFQCHYSFSATTYKTEKAHKSEAAVFTDNYRYVNDTILSSAKKKIDSVFVKLYYFHQEKKYDEIHQSIATITKILKPVENDSLFCGIIQLHQAYYAGNPKLSKPFIDKALFNLKNYNTQIADSYSKQLFWLIEGFYIENRQEEWEPVDTMLRVALNKNKISENVKFSISNYANLALKKKEYDLVNNLAKYDEMYFNYQPAEDVNNKMYVSYSQWLQLKQKLEQWLEIPYIARSQTKFQFNEGQEIPSWVKMPEYNKEIINYDYKSGFTKLFESLNALREKTLVQNKRSFPNYNEINRKNYYILYNYFLQDFYTWAVHDHKQSEAILPLKRFLYEDVMEDDIPDALATNKKPSLSAEIITGLYKKVSQLYYDVGNAELANQEIDNAFAESEKIFNESEQLYVILELIPNIIRAKRLEGDFEKCKRVNTLFLKHAKKPEKLNEENLVDFEWFASSRIEEIFTLMAQKKMQEASDLASVLIDELNNMNIESDPVFYSTLAWTNLQYITATLAAQAGNWNSSLIDEMVSDLLNKHPTSEIFYPAQLLALKSKWRNDKKLHVLYMQNLLLYTERQLKYNFIFLSAEERMQLYAHKLNDYFDVYHEMLFSGILDAYPEIKEKVLSQSLYLKNALADGNIIDNDVLLKGNNKLDANLLNEIRSLKQKTKLQHQAAKFQGVKIEGMSTNDKIQSMWLNIIEKSKDELVRMTNWEVISEKVKPNQLYIETVRYNRTLSDSTAVYGAYVISSKGKINYFNVCNEKELIEVLNNESSSPQCASLKRGAARGSIGLSSNKNDNNKNSNFKNGDVDLLGQLLLKKLWPYVQGKSELLMVHDGLLNRISFAALQWNKKNLIEYLTLKHYSGSSLLGNSTSIPPRNSKVLIAGGLNYGKTNNEINANRLFKSDLYWQYLPGTRSEMEMLQPIFDNVGYQSELVSGDNFTDSLAMNLGNYSFVHLATHGFYFDNNSANLFYENQYNRDAMNLEPLYRCGLAISEANNPPKTVALETSGFMMGYEIANTDLRNCYLISLSACETGLGDLRNNLGVDGLSRALKIAGAKNLLISLWKVPDQATAVFMKQFYTNLFSGKAPAVALQDTQKEMSKTYPASAWAAFILVE